MNFLCKGLAGELLNIHSDAGLDRSYEYDQLGRMTKVTDGLGVFELEYDEYGNLTSEIFPDGSSVNRGYDVFKRLNSISLNNTTQN